jgi:predicted nucleotidyltransferase
MLKQKVVGINHADIKEMRKPKERLQALIEIGPKDQLEDATQRVVKIALESSNLVLDNLGVFGSMLHNFHHPKFSDIDLVVYGRKEISLIREKLQELYSKKNSGFRNEFGTKEAIQGKKWKFKNYNEKEFLWHQKRKKIYSFFNDHKSKRVIKAEFEPVKNWSEITSEYDAKTQISRKGWVRMEARVIDATESAFIPSIYYIKPLTVLKGRKEACDAQRVVSYMEEFRLQAEKDEKIRVEGNLEEVVSPKGSFYQITLTYCSRYYEQVLKVQY